MTQGSGGPGRANNTYRQVKIFLLEFPLVEVRIGTRKPSRFTPGTLIRSYINRIAVLTEQVRARTSAVVANEFQGDEESGSIFVSTALQVGNML